MSNWVKTTAFGVVSTAALLVSACTYTPVEPSAQAMKTYEGSQYAALQPLPRTHYASSTRIYSPRATTYPTRVHYASSPAYSTRTYYASTPTTLTRTAPYGTSVHYGPLRPVHRGTGLRPAMGYTYGSLGGVLYDIDGDAVGIQGRLGYQSTGLLGAELEGSVGILDDDETVGAITTETDFDYSVAGFALARLPVSPQLSLHGRGGYHATRIDRTVGAVSTENTRDGLAYGAGAEYAFNNRDSVRLDYTIYEIPGSNLDALSLGFQRKF